MKYVYVVMYAFKKRGGITFGYSNVEIDCEIDHYEYLEQIADNIAKGGKPDKGTKVVILNYVLLRKEEQEDER
jgi:hypothetical protein